jgi:hypothetical protein
MSMKKQRYASLCTKRREGVFRLRLKRYKFRLQQSNLHREEKVKIYYKVWTNIQSNVQFFITVSFTEIIQKPLKIYAGGSKKQHSAIFEMCFGLLTFGIVIMYTTKQYKVKSNYKRARNMYKYHTDLSKLRASSLASSRPPFAQICVINLLPMLRLYWGCQPNLIEIG